MAKYRQIHTEFWTDGFVLDLTPEEKYFYLYIMSNSKTSQCGVYELPKRIVEIETGYNRETVTKLLQRFHEYGKIDYCEETKELYIRNWIKYNPPNNINAKKCIVKELGEVKNLEFAMDYVKKAKNEGYVLEGLPRVLQGAYKTLPSNKVINNKEEIISNKEEVINNNGENETAVTMDDYLDGVIKVFNNNIHPITPIELQRIEDWVKDMDPGVIILAIEEAVGYNARNMKYINGVLNNWLNKNIKTVEDVEAYKKDWKEKKAAVNEADKSKYEPFDFD